MPQNNKPPVTQRAYTLRLRGADPQDTSWRDALWATHEAVNKGAKVFGDWLLTLRGGLDHSLADAKVKGGNSKPDRDPTDEERKARRILLALSWLSVESRLGAPANFIIASGTEASEDRNSKVAAAFEEILKGRNIAADEIENWKQDCLASLSAAIREDAVWVNRSKAFNEAVKLIGDSLTREEVWDLLERFFGSREAYLAPAKGSEDESSDTGQEEKAKDLVQKAGQWLSSRFGTGKGADFKRMKAIYEKIAQWATNNNSSPLVGTDPIVNLANTLQNFNPASNDLNGILGLISGPGYKSATRNLLTQIANKTTVTQEDLTKLSETAASDKEKCETNTGSKGQRLYSNTILKDVESVCEFTYRVDKDGPPVSVAKHSKYDDDYSWGSAKHSEFAVILDHAARRVSLAHTWIKLAEAERRRFEEDARKIDDVPDSVKKWLDSFCLERSRTSGALEPYRIRRRAVDGWKEVVAAWGKSSCAGYADRIAAARALQDNPEIDKIGDIQLFEALAEDDAVCVWHKDGNAVKSSDHQPLIDYALAAEAEFKKRHFKVPAYRHPDALLHPIFCDFGNSRWKIDFSIRKASADAKKKAEEKVTKKQKEFEKAQTALKKAGENGKNESATEEKLDAATKKLSEARKEFERLSSVHLMRMSLWNGETIAETHLLWQSKRLVADLALEQNERTSEITEVTRADRLGRAASNVNGNSGVKISGLFEQKDWNGRLQAPRQQLEAIAARVEKHGWDAKSQSMLSHLKWLVTFSAKLQTQGPWCDFASENQLNIDPKYWPHADANKKRKGHARLVLSRLPSLRVLSVDLGHRYAATCAVWEAISTKKVREACKAADRTEPKDSDLFLHLKRKVKKHKKGKEVEVEETTIYRRIGANTLPDGKPHPAPWARLDRQFLIKLQGEDREVREASNEEIWAVHQLEAELGRPMPLIDRLVKADWGHTSKQKARLEALRYLGWTPVNQTQDSAATDEGELRKPSLSVDELMFSAVRTLRLALRRHGDRARIAHYLITDEKTKPGGMKEKLDENGRINLLQNALVMWHDLFSSRGWRYDAAKNLWNAHIARLQGYQAPVEIEEDVTNVERKKKRKENQDKLRGAAKALAENENLRKTLSKAWTEQWNDNDQRWKKRLRWFKDWILPRGKRKADKSIRHVGGLSLTRLATLTEFRRKVQVGFYTRLKPNGSKCEIKDKFGQQALDALEYLREQRVKQLASRIAEAALGIGRMKRSKNGKDIKRPRERVDEPCHAVVIENLTHYRPEETRTRRENRQLMSWASSKVKKYLAEACQLHGLHLREVQAGYTSRQDSRTGAPGIRCQDVAIHEFMRSPFWRKQVAQAEKKQGDTREKLLCALNGKWKDKSEPEWKNAGTVRIPLKGGDLFVSANRNSPAAAGLQADLNAAANIGLRALLDPDFTGKWWYIPCDPKTFKPVKDKVSGSTVIDVNQSLRDNQPESGEKNPKGDKKTKEAVNLWRDISSQPILEKNTWKQFTEYWNEVVFRVIENVLRSYNAIPSQDSQENPV